MAALVGQQLRHVHRFERSGHCGCKEINGECDVSLFCGSREFFEETGLTVEVGEHIYTTDFFQISAFNNIDQIISIYYMVKTDDPLQVKTKQKPFDFLPEQIANPQGESEVFRWVEWHELTEEVMSLPIDKVVIGILKKKECCNGKKFRSL